jgi:hypothetical protein
VWPMTRWHWPAAEDEVSQTVSWSWHILVRIFQNQIAWQWPEGERMMESGLIWRCPSICGSTNFQGWMWPQNFVLAKRSSDDVRVWPFNCSLKTQSWGEWQLSWIWGGSQVSGRSNWCDSWKKLSPAWQWRERTADGPWPSGNDWMTYKGQ